MTEPKIRDISECIKDIIGPVPTSFLPKLNVRLAEEGYEAALPLTRALVVDCFCLDCPMNIAYGRMRITKHAVMMNQLCVNPILNRMYGSMPMTYRSLFDELDKEE